MFAYYLHNLDPFIFRITDGVGPRWYGMAYVSPLFSRGCFYAFWRDAVISISPCLPSATLSPGSRSLA
jgi:hypothetical protein